MSGQMSDVVVVGDVEFALVEPMSGTLVDVRAHGIYPVTMHSANSRGELARFRITDEGALMLSDLQVGADAEPPALNGVVATPDEHGTVWTYLDLDMPVAFTGDLIVGADPILDLYVHAGFLPAWHYERVTAYDIENGQVVASEDRSEQVAEYRADRTAADAAPEDEGVFERFLDSIKLRLGLSEDE